VRMVQRRCRLGLLLEAAAGICVGQIPRENLDGDRAIELGIESAVNLAHAACAQQRNNLIGSECAADQTLVLHTADNTAKKILLVTRLFVVAIMQLHRKAAAMNENTALNFIVSVLEKHVLPAIGDYPSWISNPSTSRRWSRLSRQRVKLPGR